MAGLDLTLGGCVPSGHGELIAAFVFGVLVVSLDPMEPDLVLVLEIVEDFPEFDVFDRLLCRGFPAPFFPACHPFFEAVEDVLGIAV